jgi:hypothetical protein
MTSWPVRNLQSKFDPETKLLTQIWSDEFGNKWTLVFKPVYTSVGEKYFYAFQAADAETAAKVVADPERYGVVMERPDND